jgi:hypothetical protein
VFDQYFPKEIDLKSGLGVRKDVCSIGFEPNPNHRSRLQLLQGYYNAQGREGLGMVG